jgi:hypothetical protein
MAIQSNCLRQQVFALLRESPTSAEEDLEALSQCATHIRNRMIVEGIARDCGLSLTGFLTNDGLELYYDIRRGRHNLGFIAKGWEDPGFRIGDLVEVGWWDGDGLKANSHHIMRFCATNGIAMTIQEAPIAITLQLDGVIYSEGFNRETFLQTLDSLNACVEKIHALLPGGRHGGRLPASYLCTRMPEASGRSH